MSPQGTSNFKTLILGDLNNDKFSTITSALIVTLRINSPLATRTKSISLFAFPKASNVPALLNADLTVAANLSRLYRDTSAGGLPNCLSN
eukprot:CAMPEP_0115034478 /NCGR_PEP_ID=MMETSP0216-20121206/40678_1 /TAXON_ID=223996 /ORGANISM="Protocruzia adherens, Strain Boccale" /LENGTH=89 /DNA_ID=CAMNT_0002413377 /DNA_START=236 /DNA_END=502 /DNA_ORIENTATION=-